MLRQLLKEKLIVIKPYSHIFLTKKGLKQLIKHMKKNLKEMDKIVASAPVV